MSVIHSQWLAEHALKRAGKKPLITFDSDLDLAERHLRRGYVGLDNPAFGQQLGMLVQYLRPQRQTVHSDRQFPGYQSSGADPGHPQQLCGELTNDALDRTGRLNGEHGWSESDRCPLYNRVNQQNALLKLSTLLNSTSPVDAIIRIGSRPIHQANLYRQQLGPCLPSWIKKGTCPAIVIALPELSAAQHALLDDCLVQAYLSMESREIGRQSYWLLDDKASGAGRTHPGKGFHR